MWLAFHCLLLLVIAFNSLTEDMYLLRQYYCILCAVSNITIEVSNVTSCDEEVMIMDEVALQIQITF